jgi:hypothetical protein
MCDYWIPKQTKKRRKNGRKPYKSNINVSTSKNNITTINKFVNKDGKQDKHESWSFRPVFPAQVDIDEPTQNHKTKTKVFQSTTRVNARRADIRCGPKLTTCNVDEKFCLDCSSKIDESKEQVRLQKKTEQLQKSAQKNTEQNTYT